MSYLDDAVKKLDEAGKGLGSVEKAIKGAVKNQLVSFCRQDDEFAQAVVQGGSFADCLKYVASGVKGNAISDLDAYQRAVEFFFPGAKIRCEMTIDLVGDAAKKDGGAGSIVVDLLDFL